MCLFKCIVWDFEMGLYVILIHCLSISNYKWQLVQPLFVEEDKMTVTETRQCTTTAERVNSKTHFIHLTKTHLKLR